MAYFILKNFLLGPILKACLGLGFVEWKTFPVAALLFWPAITCLFLIRFFFRCSRGVRWFS